MINWDINEVEIELVKKVTDRAVGELEINDKICLQMDLVVTHLNGTTLDFEKLVNFDAMNFAHDIYGIMNNIDRTDGKLKNNFLPRCSI